MNWNFSKKESHPLTNMSKVKDTAGRETLASPVQEPHCGCQPDSALLGEREGQVTSTRTNTKVDSGELND